MDDIELMADIELCGATASNDPWPCVLDDQHAGRHMDANGYGWSYSIKHGEVDRYEITWMSGHIETVIAHQISWPSRGEFMARGISGALGPGDKAPDRIQMHAEIDGKWKLTLSAREGDIRTIRLVTEAELIPGAE